MIHLTLQEVLDDLHRLHEAKSPLGFDIEGGCGGITCLCLCPSPTDGLVIDLAGNPLNQAILLSAITPLLEDPLVPKVCWNVAYERLILEWTHKIILRGYEDAMFRWFERYCEPPKGLKYVASLLTKKPFWAQGVRWDESDDAAKISGTDLFRYNGFDGCATIEIWSHPQLRLLNPIQESRYQINLSLIEPLNHAMNKGVRYDKRKAEQFRTLITPAAWAAQATVDRLAGVVLPELGSVREMAVDLLCLKRKKASIGSWDEAVQHAKKDCADVLRRLERLCGSGVADDAAKGELAHLLGVGVNVKSNPQLAETLKKLNLPVPKKRKINSKGDETIATSADEEELLNLYIKTGHPFPKAVLRARALRGYLQELDRGIDTDGRIRCSYSLLGTETARVTSHKFPTGSGGNLQTVPGKDIVLSA